MKFKIKDKTTSTVVFEYEDKSIAVVPIVKGYTKDDIKQQAGLWHARATEFDSVDDVPVTIGEELEITDSTSNDFEVTYKEAREEHYPKVQKQLDAAYWARNGDDTQQKSIDAEIKLVKDTIPKTWKGKRSEIDGLMD